MVRKSEGGKEEGAGPHLEDTVGDDASAEHARNFSDGSNGPARGRENE